MKRHGRVLAVLTALILTANLAFTCYAQENSDDSSESTGEKSNETITITGGIETRDPQEDPGEADETEGTSDAFLAVPASEEVTSNDLPLILEGNTLYTYGVPVVIKKDDSDQKAYIYDGSGNEKLIATPVGSLTIYGGGKNEPVNGDVNIVVDSVNIGTIYGGGYSDGTGNADVNGSVSITVKGNADASKVYGGGYAVGKSGNASANVTGSVSIDISAIPVGNHGNIYGGGYAVASGAYDASADVGSSRTSVCGRTYSVRGGGWASVTSKASGNARADVKGAVQIQLSQVDIREVYGAGYANINADAAGGSAQANAESVDIQVDGNEMMMLYGGGSASGSSVANVSGKVSIDIKNCSNLYGYTIGGGDASSGGKANVGETAIHITNSITPVEKDIFDRWVAAAVYGGGTANGNGSQANVSGSINLAISEGDTGAITGSIYGGGDASKGASAKAGSIHIALDDISGYFCEEMGDGGTQCYPSVWAGGCSDGAEGSKAGGDSTAVTLTSATAEHIWGGVENSGNPEAIGGSSTLILNDSFVTDTVTCFDSITLNQPLHITAFLGKQDGVPTQLIDNGIKAGDIIVSCDDTDSDAGWFSLKDGELDYEVTDTQSVWKIKKVPGPDTDFEVHVDASTPDVKVSVNNSAQMADKLLDPVDRQDINAGNTIGFHLRMKELEAVDDTLAEAVQNALAEDQILALHLDINLFKIRNGAETQLSEASAPIRLTIQIPEKFREGLSASEELVFSVIRVHEQEDGTLKTDILSDLDNDDSTITIETDKFSLYSLAYKKQAKSEGNHGGNGNGGGQDGSSSSAQNTSGGSANARAAKTGDTARQNEYGLLAAASLAALILLSRKKFK